MNYYSEGLEEAIFQHSVKQSAVNLGAILNVTTSDAGSALLDGDYEAAKESLELSHLALVVLGQLKELHQ